MVVPWVGFPLSSLVKKCEPASRARFITMTTLDDPSRMPANAPLQTNTGFTQTSIRPSITRAGVLLKPIVFMAALVPASLLTHQLITGNLGADGG
jgi:DMSO/TMAO reductase YedYZ molybdopterin-dependent catalytic subunit